MVPPAVPLITLTDLVQSHSLIGAELDLRNGPKTTSTKGGAHMINMTPTGMTRLSVIIAGTTGLPAAGDLLLD